MTTDSETDLGFDVCPSCKSDKWKSAKMVVMEGTTNTTGTIDGTVTDPGAFSGGVRNFLLSDKWFSWDYSLEAEIGLTSSTGLVEEVKRLMVAHAPALQEPSPPDSPGLDIIETWKSAFKEPQPPETPKNPEKPAIESVRKEKRNSFTLGMVVMLVFLIIIYASFGLNLLLVFVLYCVFGFWYSRKLKLGNKKSDEFILAEKIVQYDFALNSQPQTLSIYKSEYEKYTKELKHHKDKIANRKKEAEALYEKQLAEYEKQLAEYKIKKSNIPKDRELLWDRARVCMRCGTAYLGGD